MFDVIKRWSALSRAKALTKDAMWAMIEERFDDAYTFASEALQSFELLDPMHGVLSCVSIMGNSCLARGDHIEAESLFQRAIEVSRQITSPTIDDHSFIAGALTGYGALKMNEGLRDVAGKMFFEAIERLVDVPGHQPERAFPLFQLARLDVKQGNVLEAEASFKAALKLIQFAPHGWKNLQTLRREIIKDYAAFLAEQGRPADSDMVLNRYSSD